MDCESRSSMSRISSAFIKSQDPTKLPFCCTTVLKPPGGQVGKMLQHVQSARSTVLFARNRLKGNSALPSKCARAFSVLTPPSPKYEGHVPLTRSQKFFLGLGSGIGAFLDPRRAGKFKIYISPSWVYLLTVCRSRRNIW